MHVPLKVRKPVPLEVRMHVPLEIQMPVPLALVQAGQGLPVAQGHWWCCGPH